MHIIKIKKWDNAINSNKKVCDKNEARREREEMRREGRRKGELH